MEDAAPQSTPTPKKRRFRWKAAFWLITFAHLLGALLLWFLIPKDPTAKLSAREQEEARLMTLIEATASIDEALPLLRELFRANTCSPNARAFIRAHLLDAARAQKTEAQLLLADTYVREDAEETLFWWTIAANNTYHPEAQFALGCALIDNYGKHYHRQRALDLLALAKAQGHSAAYITHLIHSTQAPPPKITTPHSAQDTFLCGLYAAAGHEQPIDLKRAVTLWRQALEQGHPEAALFLGMHAFNTGDLPTALSYLTQAIDRTPTPPLQTLLARLYVEHLSTPEALTSALELLTHDAHAHYPPALYLLGHYNLSGILQTPHPAGHYFRQAVESKPFPAAAFAYGDCLYHGKGGLEANPEKAFPWIQMAAEASILRAQWRLAHMYREGIGTPVNIERANHWSQRAAKADSRTHAHEPSPAPGPHVKN